jgi:threonine/homoserine/homoserine lactone efflux protein
MTPVVHDSRASLARSGTAKERANRSCRAIASSVMSLAFLVTSLVIVATPGPGALYTLAAGLSRGARASILAAFACTLGTVPHLLAAITGLAAVLHASGVAFQALKYTGVAYLMYMAIRTWRDQGVLAVRDAPHRSSTGRVIVSGITINLLNPKLTIFFFAFLPQFVPVGEPHASLRMLALSGVFMVMTFVVFAAYGVFAASVRNRVLSRPRLLDRIRRALAASFLALGARLAVESR